ncbi:TPA: AAA family ATPase [Pseudomonas aeruginosa]|uniref:AAA family ATPase n=1 Tax=Pseudomonas aeruginosa TaxID=287 RepID=UPI00143E7D8E|nr:ATP-binding protein [Pseudomonas aeruginosa]MCV4134076.1 ATP-binding protein [Pseudomonas aeruginosa]QIZ24804.1 AAA family ATPase [Pseudomonas aeruginosa]HCK4348392.1 AAA family ATPase [Pseudomonas aeruginosa]HCK4349230.1 AAA family ATPase [Pseudomonas aeruginosa]HCK4349246.1 AAA family ATPase [Pseudomonas aeruginosa]
MAEITLSKIEISNYRSCVSTKFEPNKNLSVLIGRNGSGKTNILSAIQLLGGLLHTRASLYYKNTESNAFLSDSELKATFHYNGNPIIYEAQISITNNDRNEDEIISSRESWYLHSITGRRKKIRVPLNILHDYASSRRHLFEPLKNFLESNYPHANSSEVFQTLLEIKDFVKSISYYSASVFTNPSNCPISFEVESEMGARRGISISGHKKFLYDLYTSYKSKTSNYEQFIDIIGQNGLNLVDEIKFQEIETSSATYKVAIGGRLISKEKKNNIIIPNFHISDNSLSPSQLSEGTFRILALIFYIITDKSKIMLIEEPEVCIHHGLLSSIIQLIQSLSSEKQIIVSTHSDQLLDQLELNKVFRVTKSNEGTEVSTLKNSLSPEELAELKSYLRDVGGLGEYWKHGDL